MVSSLAKKGIFKSLLSINPYRLNPKILISEIQQLPSISGIYFVIRDNSVIYIGKSRNIKQRWCKYPHHIEQHTVDGDFITFIGVHISDLNLAEQLLIEYYEPILNRQFAVGIATVKKEFTLADISDAFYLGYCKGVTQGTRINRAISNTDLLQQINSRITSIDIGLNVEEDPVKIAHLQAVTANFNDADGIVQPEPSYPELDNFLNSDEIRCPRCRSTNPKKNGIIKSREGVTAQRYKCNSCNKNFSKKIPIDFMTP
jgi:hypothetical protein